VTGSGALLHHHPGSAASSPNHGDTQDRRHQRRRYRAADGARTPSTLPAESEWSSASRLPGSLAQIDRYCIGHSLSGAPGDPEVCVAVATCLWPRRQAAMEHPRDCRTDAAGCMHETAPIDAKDDLILRLAHRDQPVPAVIELIWNSLDAEGKGCPRFVVRAGSGLGPVVWRAFRARSSRSSRILALACPSSSHPSGCRSSRCRARSASAGRRGPRGGSRSMMHRAGSWRARKLTPG